MKSINTLDPSKEELEQLNKMAFKPIEHKAGICISLNEDNTLKCCVWGSPKQLACLYLELEDRLPEGVIEFADMIREKHEQEREESLGFETPVNRKLN